jgi:hypothetical protein
MIAILLTLATFAPSPLVVDVCEINTTPNFRQIILRRWHRLGATHGHQVTEWWIVQSDPLIERAGGRWVVRSEGREFFARSIRYTDTPYDPEYRDRRILCPDNRVPYLEGK